MEKKVITIIEVTHNWSDEVVGSFEVGIKVDDKSEWLSVSNLEERPEDASFERDLSSILGVTRMLEMIHEYTKKGYELKIEKLED